MRYTTVFLAALAASVLAGCMQDPASRGLAGAAAGALVADVFDENIIAGAALGGVAGVASCSIPGAVGCTSY
jgi:osmotically inducible lipoprotein OsmB